MKLLLAAALLFVPAQSQQSPTLSVETVEIPKEELVKVRQIILHQQAQINDLRESVESWKRAATKFRCA